MKRRKFIATVVSLTALSAVELATAATWDSTETEPAQRPTASIADIGPELQQDFALLLTWLSQTGWLSYLDQITGSQPIKNTTDFTQIFNPLQIQQILSHTGFEDFGGSSLIEPGKPALSLLYYALASPRVKLPVHDGQRVSVDRYPDPEHLDRLENYIYALAPLTESELAKDCVLAVFAYEFRPGAKTPHGQHADMVFSRTGISRVGTMPPAWDRENRRHIPHPSSAQNIQDAAVTPARYGLFLAHRVGHECIERVWTNSGDERRHFLLPFRKLVNGDPYLAGMQVYFSESHKDEKLARLFRMNLHQYKQKHLHMPKHVNFNLDAPPFTRVSCSTTKPHPGVKVGLDNTIGVPMQQLVVLKSVGSSVLLSSFPAPLVRDAKQIVNGKPERARFKVPRFKSYLFGKLTNRRYTTLKLLERPVKEATDFALSDVIYGGGRRTTEFHSPRNGPEFVNIRYKVSEEDGDHPQHLGPGVKDWEETIHNGGYWAALFQDNLCDGCVHAGLTQLSLVTSAAEADGLAPKLATLRVLPAFSLVSAPDFFSLVDPVDISDLDDSFLEGGTESISGARVRANPHILLPDTGTTAFPFPSHLPRVSGSRSIDQIERDVSLTITAVISENKVRMRSFCTSQVAGENQFSRDYESTTTLPDSASNVFAPGWDVTYSDADNESNFYFASFGLGSPFPEDMKLCSAANGMWPVLSPDASRTFYGNLETIPTNIFGSRARRPATSVPLLDDELGLHPDSPARQEYSQPEKIGWDGEHGPFLQLASSEPRKMQVNFTDIAKVDYVVNALIPSMNMGMLQTLTSTAVLARMQALKACIQVLPNPGDVRLTQLWLVSAEHVADWSQGANGYGIPSRLYGSKDWATSAQLGPLAKEGFLYLFAKIAGANEPVLQPARSARLVVDCTSVYVCQIARIATHWKVAWVAVTSETRAPVAQDWHLI
jgi:hypothetical protein